MELIFLGTSSGTPTKTRNVSGVVVKEIDKKEWCLIDCGEGTQHQILKTKLSLNKLKAIFITHIHGDHCYGLPGLLASAGMGGRKEALTIVGSQEVFDYIEAVNSITELHLPYELLFVNVDKLDEEKIGTFKVSSIALSHRVSSFAYVFELNTATIKLNITKLKKVGIPPAPYWGILQSGKDIEFNNKKHKAIEYTETLKTSKKIIVCGDNDQPDLLKEKSVKADVIVHEATYTHKDFLKIGNGPMHSSALKIAEFAENIGLKNLVLTHFSPRYQEEPSAKNNIFEIESEAKAVFKGPGC